MTRLFTDGAEMYDTKFLDFGLAGCTVQTATPFVSPYYYETNTGPVGKVFSSLSEAYFRVRVRFSAADALGTFSRILRLKKSGTGVVWLALDAANRLICQATTIGVLETSALVMTWGQWYLIEFYFKEANAPNGRAVVYVDGNKVIDYTGDTEPAAGVTFDNFDFENTSVGKLLVDDIAMNDTTGASDNSWCGDGIVVAVTPNGNGTHNNWHGSDGNDVDNYLLCDEFPKDDDTTYVYHDNTAATQQQFAMSHLSFTGYTIRRLYAEARARKTAATAMTLKLGQLASGGADVVSAGRAVYIGAYNRVVGDDSFVNPVDGNPWEEADIDAIEFVAEVG